MFRGRIRNIRHSHFAYANVNELLNITERDLSTRGTATITKDDYPDFFRKCSNQDIFNQMVTILAKDRVILQRLESYAMMVYLKDRTRIVVTWDD